MFLPNLYCEYLSLESVPETTDCHFKSVIDNTDSQFISSNAAMDHTLMPDTETNKSIILK